MAVLIMLHRLSLISPTSIRAISSAVRRHSSSRENLQSPRPPLNPRLKTRTPLKKRLETWFDKLKPGFTPIDVEKALRARSDPRLALDIFRWTAQQRLYKHNADTYLTMIQISVNGRRYLQAETLVKEVLAGVCPGSASLYNSIIKLCCGHNSLFNCAFDVYKKMWKSEDAKPSLETYTLLLNILLRKFNRRRVYYAYLDTVRSIDKQMKSLGIIPDTLAFNMIIKAFSMGLNVDEAITVFREMVLYGCEPDLYTYNYLIPGLCKKERVNQALELFKEMREKELMPNQSTYMILICSLAIEERCDVATDIVFDMLSKSLPPDYLTYKTLLDGLCREGRGNRAFELLDDFRKRDHTMNEETYKMLLKILHFQCR